MSGLTAAPLLTVRARTGFLVAVAVIGLAVCGEDTSLTDASALPGRTFLSESVSENGADRPLVSGTRIRLAFGAGGGITATAGCNTLGGDVRIDDDKLVVNDLSSTDIGCDDPRHDQDTWLAGLLSAHPAYTLTGDYLTLRAGPITVALLDSRVADPDRPILGTVWQLDGFIDGDVASSTPAGVYASLRFGDGELIVEMDRCDRTSTTVEILTGELDVGRLRISTDGCSADAALVAGAVGRVLDGRVRYVIEASSLQMTNQDGKGLTLRALE